ncbi:methyl-accepting chemotaxis protein [Shewanella yunxiaonensis]|uniref:Methyl-accepting chemotaxis protein n=1 Tax=Shewanella yunxiaonensis TaxID=2829809 RepID=A0ABX7YRK2_9GAMM|nr:methyl-accepting chemotaxis protein [Shewanella yunxiaonensis]QUN05249.1 methyl-accepting chemotaxis protein [Shewanella yunxiaonensis]
MMNLGVRNKVLLLALLPMLIGGTAVAIFSYIMESASLDENVQEFRGKLINERRQELIHVTEVAKEIVAYQREHNGDVNAALRNVRFGSAGYFYIYDGQGKNLFHALLPKLEGTEQINMTDPKGIKIVQGLLKSARSGDGFLTFYYQKPGTTGLVDKIGYAATVPGTDWIIGTGAYIDDIDATVASYHDDAQAMILNKIWVIISAIVLIVVVSAFLIFWMSGKMVDPILNMLRNLDDIAKGEGDLTKRLNVTGNDEIAQLGKAFNQFIGKLQGIMQDVASTTRELNDAAHHIHEQSKSIASQLFNHNQETDQVVTAITEMSSTAQEVAGNTNQVAEATHDATEEVAKAQQCVDTSLTEVSSLMHEINNAAAHIKSLNDQSQKINSVLSVIGGIAEQTNLLALNAAIEAARAGEQGRGFAVVADEVRNLASRTQASTLEINEMLSELHTLVGQAVAAMEQSQQNCKRSVESSRFISESLGAVTSSVTAINDMSTQIATAATEQSSVTEEINHNIYKIQEIVSELMQSSEEAAQMSEKVSGSGERLDKLVGQFRV